MTQVEPLGRLVKLESRSGLYLDGIWFSRDANDTLLLHVHGAFGNFYQNDFLRVFARRCLEQSIDFLPFNLAAHDGLAEGYRSDGEFEYVGGGVAAFESCQPRSITMKLSPTSHQRQRCSRTARLPRPEARILAWTTRPDHRR